MEIALEQDAGFCVVLAGDSFNPCFNGNSSRISHRKPCYLNFDDVSILVLMEIALEQNDIFLLFCIGAEFQSLF
jgi:hypothetical protein